MSLRNQQIVNDLTGKVDPVVVTALCLVNDELVGLRAENKMLAESIMQLNDTMIQLAEGFGGVANAVNELDKIRNGADEGIG